MTPFEAAVIAARCGREDIIESLRDSGRLPDLNVPPNENTPFPLCEAVNYRSLQIIRLLMRLGADPDRKCPFYGKTANEIANCDAELLSRLSLNEDERLSGYFAVHTAIGYDDLELLKNSVQEGFDPNFNFYYSMPPGFLFPSPLAYAVKSRSMRCARWLLEHGADMNRVCKKGGTTPLKMAGGRMKTLLENFMRRGSSEVAP